jgi:beta-1,4-mannosyltransferase
VADVVWQAVALGRTLAALPPLEVILVQNPPTFPTLLVAPLVARLRRARLVIDWHNLGGRMLALRLGAGHPVVRVAALLERRLARLAHAHLCVSAAMRDTLAGWGLAPVGVLRDRPPRHVPRPSPAERGALLARLGIDAADGTALVITSSSFSADEDFGLLIDAMAACDAAPGAPELLFVLTGDGPERARWEAAIAARGLRRVRALRLWVAAEDYPLLLSCADLGVSLHRSASGLDLPMKIADMFGAGLPVAALDYGPVLAELVRDGENGVFFHDAAGLAAHILALLAPPRARLAALREGVRRTARVGWIEGWRDEAEAVLT